MKLLLYCTKAKPYLLCEPYMDENKPCRLLRTNIDKAIYNCVKENAVNGKIVAECDFEFEKIKYDWYPCNIVTKWDHYYTYYRTNKMEPKEFYKKSCLNWEQLNSYLNDYDSQAFKGGYAIHINNLHIFDKPKELSEFVYEDNNMQILEAKPTLTQFRIIATNFKDVGGVFVCEGIYGRYISLTPEELCRILNNKQTIIIRKKILKEMK